MRSVIAVGIGVLVLLACLPLDASDKLADASGPKAARPARGTRDAAEGEGETGRRREGRTRIDLPDVDKLLSESKSPAELNDCRNANAGRSIQGYRGVAPRRFARHRCRPREPEGPRAAPRARPQIASGDRRRTDASSELSRPGGSDAGRHQGHRRGAGELESSARSDVAVARLDDGDRRRPDAPEGVGSLGGNRSGRYADHRSRSRPFGCDAASPRGRVECDANHRRRARASQGDEGTGEPLCRSDSNQ